MVTWSCLGFPFVLVPTSTYLAWSLTIISHSKTIRVVLLLLLSCLSENCTFEVGEPCLYGHRALCCYYSFALPIVENCSLVRGSAAEYRLQLLQLHMYSVARLCPDQSFLSLCHRRHVARLSMLYKVNSNSNDCSVTIHLVLTEFDILELPPQVIHRSLKYQICRMTFPTLCLATERWIGLREQSTIGCFPIAELCFLVFCGTGTCGVAKEIYKHLVLPTCPCAAGFNNNNNKKTLNYKTS